ncbi:MAG: acyl-CoA dehydrogenase family protein [Gammaproteobacteria bacterium]|nr:acyl-CoA dehydrogenase family protein [Gammaproteobacteria bacterium]
MTPETAIRHAKSLVEVVRSDAETSDANRQLSQSIANAMAVCNLYRIAAPQEFNGLDADSTTQMQVLEIISQASGAAGWNLMIGVEIFGLLAPSLNTCKDLLADPLAIMAGSTAFVGNAEESNGSYKVSGQWQFVSGINNADVFGATVRLTNNGEAIDDRLFYAMIPKGKYEILDTWHVAGLRGSGSHDVKVDEVTVPSDRIVATLGHGNMKSLQLNLPLGVRLTFNKVAVALGIARSGIDAFCELASGKVPRFSTRTLYQRPFAHQAVARAEARLRGARAAMYEHAEQVWDVCQRGDQLNYHDRAIAHVLACDAVKAAIESVNYVTEAAGTSANILGSPLERIIRDVRVVQQHVTVAPHHMEDAGRVLLGMEPRGILLM